MTVIVCQKVPWPLWVYAVISIAGTVVVAGLDPIPAPRHSDEQGGTAIHVKWRKLSCRLSDRNRAH